MGEDIEIPNLTDSQKMYQAMIEGLMKLNGKVEILQTVQARHQHILVEGNGNLPLLEQVRNNTKFIDGIKYWSRFVVGALLIHTLAFGLTALVAIIRFLPLLEKLANQP